MECGLNCRGTVEITPVLAGSMLHQWSHTRVPLACFSKAGADLKHITKPFELSTPGQLALSVANIRIESGAGASLQCPR